MPSEYPAWLIEDVDHSGGTTKVELVDYHVLLEQDGYNGTDILAERGNYRTTQGVIEEMADEVDGGMRIVAPADVLATADTTTMARASGLGLTRTEPHAFATNTMTIVTPPGNPAAVTSLADLAQTSRVTTVLCAPQVPCGAAAVRVEQASGVLRLQLAPRRRLDVERQVHRVRHLAICGAQRQTGAHPGRTRLIRRTGHDLARRRRVPVTPDYDRHPDELRRPAALHRHLELVQVDVQDAPCAHDCQPRPRGSPLPA